MVVTTRHGSSGRTGIRHGADPGHHPLHAHPCGSQEAEKGR